jgi:hypothetical protein
MLATPHTKMLCWDQFCVGTTGLCQPKVLTFGCQADMLPTCWQHSQPSCICSTKLAALQLEYPLTRIACVTFTLVSGFALYATKKCGAFSARSLTLYSFLFEDMLKCLPLNIQKMGRRIQCAKGKRKQCVRATLPGPMSQDYVEQIPNGMSWLTIHNSTGNTELTINVKIL